MRYLASVLVLLATVPAAAQIVSRPTDPPVVTAENESWYRLGEPLVFAGDVYYPAGPAVFFNGNTMVRTGHYNGVPLYADTTIEPYSIVYVPIGRGVMQPYERMRRGALAGTAGSRTPSFPAGARADVPAGAWAGAPAGAAAAPTGLPRPIGAVPAFTPESGARGTAGLVALAVTQPALETARPAVAIATVRPPQGNDGIWLDFMGARWVIAGPAVPLLTGAFVEVGTYRGFPVFARAGLKEDRIYLPTLPGLIAPFRLKE
jgi:hypothetical protein